MKRLFLFIVSVFFLTAFLFAQEKEKKQPKFGWKNQMVGGLNFTQNAFSKNWSGGGANSWSWAVNIDAKVEYDQREYNWFNSGRFAYGQASIGGNDPRKAADEIKLETVYTHKINKLFNPYAAAAAQTQLTAGFTYVDANDEDGTEISDFFDPGYFTESFGVNYKPNQTFKSRFGVAAKQTFTTKYEDTYAKGEEFHSEIGFESVTDLNVKVSEQILYVTKFGIFTDLGGIADIDVNWDNSFSAKVSEIISVSFNFRLIYDKDIHIKRQLKQTLAVGISYSFL